MKKKFAAIAVALVMAFSSVNYSFAHEVSTVSTTVNKVADLKSSIIFSYPEDYANFDSKNLSIDLNLENSKVITIPVTKASLNSIQTIDNYTVQIEATSEDNLISEIEITVSGLTRANDYSLTFSANGHKSYTTNAIDLSKASQKVIIQTNNSTFTIGDVNADGIIDEDDVLLLEEAINENSSNRQYDLNGDGVIDINDIAFVNHHIETNGAEVVGAYEYFVEELIDTDQTEALLTEAGITIESGSLSDLSDSTSTLTLKSETVISEETPLELPLIFEEPVEMETIEITGSIDGGYVTVETEDGEELILAIENSSQIALRSSSSSSTVTVSLGTKVAVKKVTITVTSVTNSDGSTEYVSLQEVKFLQDIGQDEAGTQTVVVTGVTASEGNKEITLSWNEVSNITGYKVYYGTTASNLNQTVVTDKTSVTISGLENLTTYYFSVTATSDGYESSKSTVISATPQPSAKPNSPDFLTVEEVADLSIKVSWGKTENAVSYNVYYKKSTDTDFTQYTAGLTATNITIYVKENDIPYEIYVTAVNNIGESEPSLTVQATPTQKTITIPTLPTKNKMDNSNIEQITIAHADYYDTNLYPNGFENSWVADEDFTTSWVARRYWEDNSFTFTFDEPITSDYVILVPRLDEDKYRNAFDYYTISIWYEDSDLSSDKRDKAPYSYTNYFSKITAGEDNSYFILSFPKQENIKKINVFTYEKSGDTRVSISEVVFYEYSDIPDRIEALFKDDAFTELAENVTLEEIEKLIEEVNDLTGFLVSSEILLKELNIAKSLLENDTSALGVIKDNIFSINPSEDAQNYNISINNFQPLGIVGEYDEEIAIYAEIPDGEIVTLVPTQFYEEANSLTGTTTVLKNGRNIITIPKIGSKTTPRGGSLYITYNGDKASEIKLHIVGGTKIPYLELHDMPTLSEEEISNRISEFIDELESYQSTLTGTISENPLNQSEVSLPDVLLSLPASKVYSALESSSTKEEKITQLKNNALAWEEIIKVIYKNYGIDDQRNNGLQTRQNIRYMRMFGNAFMYASGNHIGIGYDSSAGMFTGKPTSTLSSDATENNLFGWGIAHEIGHVMDKLGKAEITNNIFSLAAQTYDGKNNTLTSRLETSEIYDQVYEKVSYVTEGLPNNVFAQLAMYWQLHLAYDNGGDESFNFYNSVYKKYRENEESVANLEINDKFAVIASQVAQKDLTNFFTRWGIVLSDEAKSIISDLNLEEETKAIYYLNDESRRQRLAGNEGKITAEITATSEINSENEKQVDITITASNTTNILGYEILRNGTSIGFTTTNTYSDIINSANNMAFSYSVVPIGILGDINTEVSAGQVRIEYEKTIDESLYTTEVTDEVFKATFNSTQATSGIILKLKEDQTMPTSGALTVEIKTEVDDVEVQTTARTIDFSNPVNTTSTENKLVAYFNKPNTDASDTRIWTYDAKEISISGISNIETLFDILFISYVGDNIGFLDAAFGKLASDYVYGSDPEDVIEEGTLIIIGSYTGDPIYNTMRIEGRFLDESGISENYNIVERDINGYSLFFSDVYENEISTTISDGIFIFVPDIQAEADLQDSTCDDISVLPNQIRAVLYRSDDPYGKENNRITSTTIWVTTPDIETMPTIVIE